MIYSPPSDTEEGKERKARKERVNKTGKLEEQWKLMRECRAFIVENSDIWQQMTEQEKKKIEKEEKETRLELRKQKKLKFGKAGKSKLNSEEDGKVRKETATKKELAEIRQNLWRKRRYD